MVDYRYASITALADELREGRASSTELAAEAVRLLSELGPRYNAIATVMGARAAREAAEADRRRTAGDGPLLAGIPYGAKDLFAARGAPTTWGSANFADQTFKTDATVIRRLHREGAVLAAKLAMSEFAGGGKPTAPGASMHGQGRNPWDPARYSGGSSSGSGIAVAAGLVPYALGTETGGSTIGPAAFSGITGIRPTFGLIPRAGAMTLSWTLDKVGVLARSAEDVAIVMDAIARAPGRGTPGFHAATGVPGDAGTLRVAIAGTELDEATPSIRRALQQGIDEFRRLFPRVVEVEIDRTIPYISALEDIVRVEGGFGLRQHLRRDGFTMSDERQLQTLRSGLDVPVVDYLEALRTHGRGHSPGVRGDIRRGGRHPVGVAHRHRARASTLERAPRDATKLSDLLRAGGKSRGSSGRVVPVRPVRRGHAGRRPAGWAAGLGRPAPVDGGGLSAGDGPPSRDAAGARSRRSIAQWRNREPLAHDPAVFAPLWLLTICQPRSPRT